MHQRGGGSNNQGWPVLANVVRKRAGEQLVVAQAAEAVAETSAKGMLVDQQALVASMAVETAEEDFAKGMPAAPKAKAALTAAQRFLAEAQYHANHARRVEEEMRRLPETAAQTAVQTIENEVQREAYAAAELANALPPETPLQRRKKFAERVAAAMEPYHLALLRAQKFVVVNYAKAKSAVSTAQRLADEAQRLASSAQRLQATGLTVQAKQTMLLAYSTMQNAGSMREWAQKLYAEAQKVNDSVGQYQLAEVQAAMQAAKTVPVKVQPTLPPMPPR